MGLLKLFYTAGLKITFLISKAPEYCAIFQPVIVQSGISVNSDLQH
jgi:hypothetical protein